MSNPRETLLCSFSPEFVAALVELVDERVAVGVPAGSCDGSPWLSLAEAAEYLRVSQRQVQRLVARGKVRSSTVGRRRLVHRDDLDKAATGEGVAPTTPPRHREE